MSFLKSFFASFLAVIAVIVLAFIFLIVIISSLSSEKLAVIEDNSVLHLKLDAQITELQKDNPFEGLPLPGGDVKNIGLIQLINAIEHAKADDKIKGIYVDVSYPNAGFSSIEEIRQALIDFKESGKWVVAYSEVMSEGGYYLASAADEVYLNPHGDIEFNGLTITVSFFKKLFDKLEIKPQVFRVGEFKSAVEPFILDQMSKENEEQLSVLAGGINDFMLSGIASTRKIEQSRLSEISNNMLVKNAAAAKELGLVDELLYEDEFRDNIRKRLGIDDDKKIKFVTYDKYRKSYSDYKSAKNEVAVIVAEGTIMPGDDDNQDGVIAADSFIGELRKARRSSKVKAIVIRINSPGGEFRASDMMWREIQVARKEKPVIASMSDYAASGGYYMAMGCDTIVAQPNTITGSIGIFMMVPDLSGFLSNKIGITFDEVKTGNFGEMFPVIRPLTEQERNYWQRNLEEHYETFTTKAADGRQMPVEELKKYASGRVWTGTQGRERNLVDIEGGINDAIEIAAKAAGIEDDYRVKYYPKQKTFFEQWMSDKEESARAEALKVELGDLYQYYKQFQQLKTYQGSQARMPFEIRLH